MKYKNCDDHGSMCPCMYCDKNCCGDYSDAEGNVIDTDILCEKAKEHCESRDRNNKNGNTNPLAAYRVTDDEFEFLEKLYKLERKAFWKGVLIVGIIVIAILVLFHIVT